LALLADLDRLSARTIIELFDRIPREVLPVLAGEYPGEVLPLLRAYARAIRSLVARFEFAYADMVAPRMRSVFVHAPDGDIKINALSITLVAAAELNRFAAMNAFNSLLATVKDTELAIAAGEMLRAHARHYQKLAREVPSGRLHPAIREVRAALLCDSDEV